jgi:transposase
MSRKAYPSDVSDDEWALIAPYLTLMKEDAPQREHYLREVFNALRWIGRTGSQWRRMRHDLPPWYTMYPQGQRWINAGVFEDMVHDLRALLRLAKGKKEQPTAAIFDGRTMQSTPESGERAGYDGPKKKKGSQIHMPVDTLGLLLALHVTPAIEQECAQVKELAEQVQASVEVALVDPGYTGDPPAQEAQAAGMELMVAKLPESKKGFVLLSIRWVVERSFNWTASFRRLARDFERTPEVLRGLHFVAFAILMLQAFIKTIAQVL